MHFKDKKEHDNIEDLFNEIEATTNPFNQSKHDSEARKEITKLFLKWYFCLIVSAFSFAAFYNFMAAWINHSMQSDISFLDVSNTVSIITTTLSSGVGFVIGYYFKNKGDKD